MDYTLAVIGASAFTAAAIRIGDVILMAIAASFWVLLLSVTVWAITRS